MKFEAVLRKAGIKNLPRFSKLESSRAHAIVGAALLDHLLEQVLRHHMIGKPEESLFGAYGPLSSFSAKIDIAKSLGILTAGESADLHRVRKIRNAFAHSLDDLSFRDRSIQNHVHQLQVRAGTILGKKGAPRLDFELCVLVLSGFLLGRIEEAIVRPNPREFVGHLATLAKRKRGAQQKGRRRASAP